VGHARASTIRKAGRSSPTAQGARVLAVLARFLRPARPALAARRVPASILAARLLAARGAGRAARPRHPGAAGANGRPGAERSPAASAVLVTAVFSRGASSATPRSALDLVAQACRGRALRAGACRHRRSPPAIARSRRGRSSAAASAPRPALIGRPPHARGIFCPISFSIAATAPRLGAGRQRDRDAVAPARPVRPMRCT
jgi:hypothetical protein